MRGLIGGWQWQRKGVSIGVNNLMDRMNPPNHADRMDGIRDRSDSAEINPGREHYRRGGCGSPPCGHNRLVFISRAREFLGLKNDVPGQPTATTEFVGFFGAREWKLLGDVHP